MARCRRPDVIRVCLDGFAGSSGPRRQHKFGHHRGEPLRLLQIEPMVAALEDDILAIGDELADRLGALDGEAAGERAV